MNARCRPQEPPLVFGQPAASKLLLYPQTLIFPANSLEKSNNILPVLT